YGEKCLSVTSLQRGMAPNVASCSDQTGARLDRVAWDRAAASLLRQGSPWRQADVEDLVQEARIKIVTRRNTWNRWGAATEVGYIRRVVENRLIDLTKAAPRDLLISGAED